MIKVDSINGTARIAGALYLFVAVCGGFAYFVGYESLFVATDAIKTANNIMASESIFRMSIVGDSLLILAEIVMTVLLYLLFKPVSKTLSMIAGLARLAMTAMIGMNILNKLIVLQLLSGAQYLKVFNDDQIQALAMIFLTAYGYGTEIWGVFFGLHLFIIGYLIFKSDFLPGLLGALFLFASFGYLIDSLGGFVLPQYQEIYTVIILATIPAELSLAFWLLIKGVNVKRWEGQNRTI
ncbi:MAG: hypothetical protein ACI845_002735 [Gammaproteobacteria bacterium]|jgi:hypothetical protein